VAQRCARTGLEAESPASVKLDHVIIATTDPVRSARHLTQNTGLTAVEGGPHDGLGTYNYIVPLTAGYLELVTVQDRQLAQDNAFGQLVLAALRDRDEAIAGWAVEVDADELNARAKALNVPLGQLTRRGVGIRHVGMQKAVQSPGLPFFLARDPHAAHPQSMAADHRVRPLGVTTLTIGESQDDLDRWFGTGGPGSLPVTCRGGGRAILRLEVATDMGPVVLTESEPTGRARS
jgi:Glyoxalase-like domain